MTTQIGEFALAGTLLCAIATIFAALMYVRLRSVGALRIAQLGMVGLGGLLSLAAWSLLSSLLNNDFSVAYVAEYSERALPFGYKIAAFWAGQAGSLLLWAWLLGVMGVVLVARLRRRVNSETAVAMAIMAAVTGFFAALMIFAASPFDPAASMVADGQGLNPMLQNVAMVAHPPMLFLGYAGFTAPFALLLAALLTGRRDSAWIGEVRGWVLFSWLALTVGIILGAQWAYVELGWGGYWAWDPVENASLLPWLTGTALLHSLSLVQRRGMFKRWVASLITVSFLLCLLGTYLTRSGILDSVHSFPKSSIGWFFLVFMILIAATGLATILSRRQLLLAEHHITDLLSREGAFLAVNVLLVLMTLVTLAGTLFPLFSGIFTSQKITPERSFYNITVLPLALALAAVMAIGPVLTFGPGAAARAKRLLTIVAAMAGAAAAVAFLLTADFPALGSLLVSPHFTMAYFAGIMAAGQLWTVAVSAVLAGVLTGMTLDFASAVKTRRNALSETPLAAVAKVLALDHRRWGAQIVHLGIAAIILGVAGSSLYSLDRTQAVAEGQTARVGSYAVAFQGLDQISRANHDAVIATVLVTDARGNTLTLHPERRFYAKSEPGQSASEVAIHFALAGDIYVNLAGWDDNGKTATLQVIINPLVDWIWIGGGILALGAILCMIPRRAAKLAPAPSPQPVVSAPRRGELAASPA